MDNSPKKSFFVCCVLYVEGGVVDLGLHELSRYYIYSTHPLPYAILENTPQPSRFRNQKTDIRKQINEKKYYQKTRELPPLSH